MESTNKLNNRLLSAYIANLEEYNKGNLVGEWVKFPTTAEEIQKMSARIGIEQPYDEWLTLITDYDCNIPGIQDKLGEHENLDELNYFAAKINQLREGEYQNFLIAVDIGDYANNIKELINLTDNLDKYSLYPDVTSYRELGKMHLNDLEVPDYLENYIDFEAYGRDIAINEIGKISDYGYVCDTQAPFVEYYDGKLDSIPKEYRVSTDIPMQEQTQEQQIKEGGNVMEQQFIGKTVGEFIKEHPQTTLELMTPGGYVLLNAEIMQRAIERNGKIYPNLGFRGSEYETELNDILSQYINSINPKEDDPNYLYMMTADHFEDVEFETGGKTMDVKQENQSKINEGVKNMEQISNETKNKSETLINPIELKAKSPEGKIIEIGAKVTQGIKDLFDSEKYKEYLQVMSKFHNYSLKNTVLIAMQMPTATKVTNFNTWKFGLGRTVKKGEQGMKIMSPMPVKTKQEIEKIDPQTDKPVLDDAGNPIKEEQEITTTAVKVTTVFDVSQTEGKDLENSNTPTENIKDYKDFYTAVEKVSNVPINAKDGNDQGKIKEAINEITNTKLQTLQDKSPNALDKRTREIQAASVAYTVCKHYGLDTSNYSFDNVSEWSNGRKFTELRDTLETIHTAADNIIEDINQNVMALAKSKEQAQEQEPRPYHEPVNDDLVNLKQRIRNKINEKKKTRSHEMER